MESRREEEKDVLRSSSSWGCSFGNTWGSDGNCIAKASIQDKILDVSLPIKFGEEARPVRLVRDIGSFHQGCNFLGSDGDAFVLEEGSFWRHCTVIAGKLSVNWMYSDKIIVPRATKL
ncbi:hypothetical protein ACFX13_040461 [Malus domestica]